MIGNKETARPVMILAPMEEEGALLASVLTGRRAWDLSGWRALEGKLAGRPAVLLYTGVGQVCAAMALTLAIPRFHPAAVIVQGTAGAHRKDMKPGDLVIATAVFNAAMGTSEARAEGQGVNPAGFTLRPEASPELGLWRERTIFHADESLLAAARRAAAGLEGRVWEGPAASADCWNREADRILAVHRQTGSLAEEMEGAAAAQACLAFGTPWLEIRVISNNELTGEPFDRARAVDCQRFVLALIDEFWKDQDGKNNTNCNIN